MSEPIIPPEVAEHLGYYVYLYIDPRDDKPFYVGKGVKRRILSHLDDGRDSLKHQRINELRDAVLEPRLEVLTHGLRDEETAFRIEAAVIDLLGLGSLTNAIRGWKSVQFGRLPLRELVTYYAAKPVEIREPVLLIRINKQYRHNMSAKELYEATRGVWRIGRRRENATHALAVFEGVVREVFEIHAWHPAGSTPYETREDVHKEGRWEFTGGVAEQALRSGYCNGKVSSYFRRGAQSPVVYVNC